MKNIGAPMIKYLRWRPNLDLVLSVITPIATSLKASIMPFIMLIVPVTLVLMPSTKFRNCW